MAEITVAHGRCWQYSHYVGRQHTAGKGFNLPVGVAVGNNDTLYVANRTNPRITKATVDQEFIKEFGRGTPEMQGPFPSRYMWLTAIALDKDENVYITDEWHHAVIVYTKDGELLKTWGEQGEEEGKLNGPSGMAFDSDDNVWIVNSLNSRIQKFTKNGLYLGGFGEKGSGEGELDLPWGITIDNAGHIYIADWNNHRIQKFSTVGTHLLTFGSGRKTGISHDGGTIYENACQAHIAVNPKDLNHPTGVAVDSDGDIYVADRENNRVQLFNSEPRFVEQFIGDATLSKASREYMMTNASPNRMRDMADLEPAKRLRRPASVAVDERGRMFVPDFGSYRVQVYQKEAIHLDSTEFGPPRRSPTLNQE